jgi:hypothetical protein
MKPKTILSILVFCLVGIAVCYSQDPFMGTWKLNEKQSIIPAGAPKNNTVIYQPAGGNIEVTVDGIASDGQPIHSQWTGQFDGKDYPVTGDPNSETRAYTKLNDHLLRYTVKKGGKETTVGRVGIASDGKSRTATGTGTNAEKGERASTTSVFEKR